MEAICNADYNKRVNAKKDFEKEIKKNSAVMAPSVGFHDIYGVWFFGNLCSVIRQIRLSKFAIDQEKMMHVFIDTEPGKVPDGIHDIMVYGHHCRLYKWQAQGYHRGLVVLANDVEGCATATVYMESRTWSWLLNDEDQVKLPPQTDGG